MSSKYTGQLYQLRSKYQLAGGAYVAINGPWDTYGAVVSSTLTETGEFLNLIRGVKERKGERAVAQF